MKRRNSWLLAATFVLSLCTAPAALAQDQPGQNRGLNAPQKPDQLNLNLILDEDVFPLAGQHSDGAKQGGNPSQNQAQPSQANQPKSDAKQGNQNANNKPAQSPQWDTWSRSFNKNQQPGKLAVWTNGGPHNEVLRWSYQGPMTPLSLAPVDDSLRVNLGLPEDQGLVVTAVEPNSSAAQAGIQTQPISCLELR